MKKRDEREERDVSDLAFLSEAYVRTSKNITGSAETKKMLKDLRKEVKKPLYHRVLKEIETTVDNAADRMKRRNQKEFPPDLAEPLLRDDDPFRKMAGETLDWTLQNMESQKRKSGRAAKALLRY
ncbi:MAG: hypothetical protein OEW18_05820 [Candidatus Aminicenantes bacterium]|nr:hypothetical protein [Candidatus Aminicenantes bacterium]